MNDQADIAADAHRPEVAVLGLIEFMKLHPRIRRVDLQVKCRRLDGLLLVARQAGEAIGERVGDAEVHFVFPSGVVVIFPTPKGSHSSAQGNALGNDGARVGHPNGVRPVGVTDTPLRHPTVVSVNGRVGQRSRRCGSTSFGGSYCALSGLPMVLTFLPKALPWVSVPPTPGTPTGCDGLF